MDPFHDFPLSLSGLPDMTGGASVVRCFKLKQTIVRPTSLAATDKWDCHIFTLPFIDTVFLTSRTVETGNQISGILGGDAGAQGIFGTVNAISGAATGEWFSPTTGLTGLELKPLVAALNLSRRSLARIIGLGFEVHNDTPQLYKGGSVTVYDCPQGDFHHQLMSSTVSSLNANSEAKQATGPWVGLRRPPDNVSQAMQMPNSVTWEAAEGCYVVNKIDLSRSNYTQPSNVPILFTGQGGADSLVVSGQKELVTSWEVPGLITGGSPSYYAHAGSAITGDRQYRLTPIHTSGAYFNGLTPETILTLEVHIFVESLPVNDPSELALATPAAEYDPFALQLYEKSIRTLKSGVPVHMNAKGDWWKMVGNALLSAAPNVANAIIPGSGFAVKGIIDMGKKFVTEVENRPRQKKAQVAPAIARNGNAAPLQVNKPVPKPKPKKQQAKPGGRQSAG